MMPSDSSELVNLAKHHLANHSPNPKTVVSHPGAAKDQHIGAYGENLALKPGMTLEADVVQKKLMVWEWIFEPLLAARQKVKVL